MTLTIAKPADDLNSDVIADYRNDGIVCLRGLIDTALVEELREAVARVMDGSSPFDQKFDEGANGERFFSGIHNLWNETAYRKAALESAIPKVISQLTGSNCVRFFYDQTIVKEPATRSPTPWHHDLTFWPVTGQQICSAWIALDPVDPANGGVEYVRGSHRWQERFRPTQPDEPGMSEKRNMDLPHAPNFSKNEDVERLAWQMQPGDVLIFNALTLHGAGPNRSEANNRRAVVFRYAGDDARFAGGEHVLTFPVPVELEDGAQLDHPLFPIAYENVA